MLQILHQRTLLVAAGLFLRFSTGGGVAEAIAWDLRVTIGRYDRIGHAPLRDRTQLPHKGWKSKQGSICDPVVRNGTYRNFCGWQVECGPHRTTI